MPPTDDDARVETSSRQAERSLHTESLALPNDDVDVRVRAWTRRPRAEPRDGRGRSASRLVAGGVAVALVGVGLVVSRVDHPVADPVGDALYAAFVFAVLVVVAPRARSATVAGVTLAICAAVELAQLTGIPAAVVDAVPVARYALGTTFVAVDLLAYGVGAGLAWVVRR